MRKSCHVSSFYDFNGCTAPYARSYVYDGGAGPPVAAAARVPRTRSGSGAPAPSCRSGEPRSTTIGGAARATLGCLAPRTHKYPDAVPPDFRTTPWLDSTRFHASYLRARRKSILDLTHTDPDASRSTVGSKKETSERPRQKRGQSAPSRLIIQVRFQ